MLQDCTWEERVLDGLIRLFVTAKLMRMLVILIANCNRILRVNMSIEASLETGFYSCCNTSASHPDTEFTEMNFKLCMSSCG